MKTYALSHKQNNEQICFNDRVKSRIFVTTTERQSGAASTLFCPHPDTESTETRSALNVITFMTEFHLTRFWPTNRIMISALNRLKKFWFKPTQILKTVVAWSTFFYQEKLNLWTSGQLDAIQKCIQHIFMQTFSRQVIALNCVKMVL